MIKMKRAEIAEQYNKLVELTSVQLPAKAAVRLGEILDEMKIHISDFKKLKMELIKTYVDNHSQFNIEIIKLMNEDVEFKARPIPETCLDDISLTLAHARNLWMFVD